MAENKSATFEQSLARLQAIVTELEGDNLELERAVALYKEGRELVGQCEGMLKTAEATLRAASGNGGAAPAAEDERLEDELSF